jgi:hypothetical protein
MAPLADPQLCYALLHIGTSGGEAGARPVNWALVADASRSMCIPIVDEAQFRALIREGGAQETLVDGVPVWQLSTPVPPEVRATSRSALDHVARALHSVVERLDGRDRFALVACAEEAVLLTRSSSGAQRAELARGITRLASLNLGEQTDLAQGIALGCYLYLWWIIPVVSRVQAMIARKWCRDPYLLTTDAQVPCYSHYWFLLIRKP